MGHARRPPRSFRIQCLTRLVDIRFLSLLFGLVTITSSFLLIFERLSSISRVKTIVGDNLEPTPWHLFPKKVLPSSSSYTRASYIFQCNYLSCTLPINENIPNQNGSIRFQQNHHKCPPFFQWIHEDLAPWKHKGITEDDIEAAREYAAFRVTIIGGQLYVEPYYDCFQSRMMFTIWGVLQLLDRYPGMVPDVDIMFDCMDKPMIKMSLYKSRNLTAPPLFRYCSNKDHLDIPFPDWSFWGWAETSIAPWEEQFSEIMKGSKDVQWKIRKPVAFWKGNPDVASPTRTKLLECNSSDAWGAEILRQDWVAEAIKGFEQSRLSRQCINRYKIYAEGYAWSVSLKYILSCDSPVLLVSPDYYDFFTRGLMPRQHYWPIRVTNLCPSIKFAVDWGNTHPNEAQAIGEAGQRFMQNLDMDTVYNYMFHLIFEYSKLQKFKPRVPPSARQICKASVLCLANSKERDLLRRSISKTANSSSPCKMPKPRHDLIMSWVDKKHNIINEIANMEDMIGRESTPKEEKHDESTSRTVLINKMQKGRKETKLKFEVQG